MGEQARRVLPLLVAWLGATALAPGSWAQSSGDIFVSMGALGEPSFSDVDGPGARRVEVETAAPREDSLAEMQRRISQTLAVAGALEDSRLARERARAEARAEAASRARPPQVIYRERYAGGVPYRFGAGYPATFERHRYRDRERAAQPGDRAGRDEQTASRSRELLWRPD